jgi:hypothetical protein
MGTLIGLFVKRITLEIKEDKVKKIFIFYKIIVF